MKIRFFLLSLIGILILISSVYHLESRGRRKKKNRVNNENTTYTKMSKPEIIKSMEDNCFSCHNQHTNINSRIAPTWQEIKNAYKSSAKIDAKENSVTISKINTNSDKNTKNLFIESFSKFIDNPNDENAKMPGSIKKYGIMPKFSYKSNDIKNIAELIYETDLNNDTWYLLTKKENESLASKNENNKESYLEKSIRLATATKQVLGKNLLTSINTKGVEKAIDFCNIKAISLTDSMSKELNAKIKRVSDKPRNPNNKANKEELKYIESIKKLISQKKEIKPYFKESKNKAVTFMAIETNKMCLQCHGNSQTDIKKETFANINKKYPKDKAIGYSENEIRGIFVVEINK